LSGREASADTTADRVVVIETNIDDMNPQAYGFLMDRAFETGALDVFVTPVQMKKGRPGVLLTVICTDDKLNLIGDLLLSETTTLGIRYYYARRRKLDRTIEVIQTQYGAVKIKVAREGGRTLHFQPEYEECVRLAREGGVPLLEVQSAAIAAYRRQRGAEITDGKP
jgi:uncharacterized protein (DUF111 family)